MRFLIIIICLSFSLLVKGQNTIGFNIQGFLPTGELKNDASELGGVGTGLEAVFTIKQSPFHVGGISEWNHFGATAREGNHGPGLEDVRVKRNFENIKLLGLFRFKPDCGENIFPYFDVVLGPGYVFTRTTIRENQLSEPIDSFFEIKDWAFMYGFGFGNEFFLTDTIILDVFFRTIKSSRIEYLSPEGVEFNSTTNWYDLELKTSAFNHINFGFGLKFKFNEFLDLYSEIR